MKFDWDQIPGWVEERLARAVEAVTVDQPYDRTIELRAEIRVYRAILKLPTRDPDEGYTQRLEDA